MEIKKNHNKYQIYYRCPNFPKTIYESFDSLKKQIFVPHKLSSTRKTVFGYRILPPSIAYIFWNLLVLYASILPCLCHRSEPTTHLQHTFNAQ